MAQEIPESALDQGLKALLEPQRRESVVEAVRAVAGSAPRVLLRDIPGEVTPVVTPGGGEAAPRRYQVFGELARGGVGVVLKGRDVDLGRDVAMKVLRECHAASPELVQRFIEEAQIGGQLQHPGIVPVYELGLQADQRPYFTMKLVKGQTLSSLLQNREGPAQERRRFLGIFEQVCQTMAYAHARGVIHRDLKPSNVMVGAFGEVQVVDWGFAKVLAKGGVADEAPAPKPQVSVIATVRSGSSGSQSEAGSVMGTPAYMPPEQARGDVAGVNERSDVFALGAILCEVLTGKPPYALDEPPPLVQAAEARLDDAYARLDGCGADAELIALAKRCLAPAKGARPRDAGVVAEAVSAHLAAVEERARQAEVRAAEARVRAEDERRARGRTLALAAAVLVAVVAAGAGWWWAEEQRRARVQQADAAVGRGIEEAQYALGRARVAAVEDVSGWPAAVAAAERAQGLAATEKAGASSRARALVFLDDVRAQEAEARRAAEKATKQRVVVERLTELRMQRGEGFDGGAWEDALAAAFEQYGIDLSDTSIAAVQVRGSPVAEELIGALHDWMFAGRQDLRHVLAVADPDPLRVEIRGADAEALDAIRLRGLNELPTRTLLLLADALGNAKKTQGAVEVAEVARAREPEAFWTNVTLGWWLTKVEPSRWPDAVPRLEAALKLRDCDGTRYHYAIALGSSGGVDSALPILREIHERSPGYGKVAHWLGWMLDLKATHYLNGGYAHAAAPLWREAASANPDVHGYQCRLGAALLRTGRTGEALETLQRAHQLSSSCSTCSSQLGSALVRAGRWDEGIEGLREATRCADAEAAAFWSLAQVLSFRRDPDGAVAVLREGVDRLPGDVILRIRLGRALEVTGRLDEAIAEFRKALNGNPFNWAACEGLTRCLRKSGREDAARRELDGCIEILLGLVHSGQFRGDPAFEPALHQWLGAALARKHTREDALAIYAKVRPKPTAEAEAQFHCGQAMQYQLHARDTPTAIECMRDMVRCTPHDAHAHSILAQQLECAGEMDEALGQFVEAAKCAPRSPDYHSHVARALERRGRFEEALYYWRRARDLLGMPLEEWDAPARRTERLVSLVPKLDDIVAGRLEPQDDDERRMFAELCSCSGHHATAARHYVVLFGEPGRIDALLNEPPLDALRATCRLQWARAAARSALSAAAGSAKDAESLAPDEAARLRANAISWLSASLEACGKEIGFNPEMFQGPMTELLAWRDDPALRAVRDPDEMGALGAEEREAGRRLWERVDEMLDRLSW